MSPASSRRRLPLIETFGSVLIAVGLILFIMLLLNFTRPAQQPVGLVTAVLTVVPAPTDTPTPSAPLITPTSSPNPQEAGENVIYVGAYVQISGTGGDGLRIRNGPGLSYEQLYLGFETEVYEVIAGPQQADEYTWWHLVAAQDDSVTGWAVGDFLEVVAEP